MRTSDVPRRPSIRRQGIRLVALALLVSGCAGARLPGGGDTEVRLVPIGPGWAQSSVNAVIFRQSSLVSHGGTQYAAYYDSTAHVVLARRRLGDREWERRVTRYTGTVEDAHNAISIAVDGEGVLHVSWDHHGGPVHYARGVRPGWLELTDPLPMTGANEEQVTYPQFYRLRGGDLLFVYRDGQSGMGDVMMNRYSADTQTWSPVQHPLISGEGERSAYVNSLAIDASGGWHLSWTWRETWDVSTNHDILYAYSPDEGRTWQRSTGEHYALPITTANAEIAQRVPQGHELINQTTMAAGEGGKPYIATYWRAEGDSVPQFRLVWNDGQAWRSSQVSRRAEPFSLSGGVTKRIPMSRPLVLAGRDDALFIVFRDDERQKGVSIAMSTDPGHQRWDMQPLYRPSLGAWEPTFDPVLWADEGKLHLLVQRVGQGDAETLQPLPPQMVSVLEWEPR